MSELNINTIDFEKVNGLIPAIIQDNDTNEVLMLGYMNKEAIKQTISSNKVTFYSRTKERIWTKGETSGNFLNVVSIKQDCDNDTLLIKVNPIGNTCHLDKKTCFGDQKTNNIQFISELENIITSRRKEDSSKSYVASLFRKGINKIAQKVGEEAVEVVIESKDNDDNLFLNESADLLFHYLILLQAKGFRVYDVIKILKDRQS